MSCRGGSNGILAAGAARRAADAVSSSLPEGLCVTRVATQLFCVEWRLAYHVYNLISMPCVVVSLYQMCTETG